MGPSAGWLTPEGISNWESELSFIPRAEMTTALARAVRGTLPVEQIASKRYPLASRAVETVPFLALSTNIVTDVRNQGVRVHTVGVDRVSSGFYYFAEGGSSTAVEVQGNLVEMLAPSLAASSTNADIALLLKDLIDRLLVRLSGGVVSELDVELANALPRLARDGSGLTGVDLDAFEQRARSLAEASTRWEASARRLVEALAAADASGRDSAQVPLYGEAKKESVSSSLDVHVGERTLTLEAPPRWTVKGAPREEAATRPYTAPSAAVERPAAVIEPARAAGVAARSEPERAASAAAAARSTEPEKLPAPMTATTKADRASPPGTVTVAQGQTAPAQATATKPEKAAMPAAAAASKPGRAPVEPTLTPLTPSPIVSIGVPTPRVEPSASGSPIGSFSEDATVSVSSESRSAPGASVSTSSSVEATAAAAAEAARAGSESIADLAPPRTPSGPKEAEKTPPAAEAPARVESAPIAAAAPKARAPISRTSQRPPAEVHRAAAMAPTGRRSVISGFGFFLLLLLAAIAYLIGRFIRHRYLHMQ